jgi:hypothetical protein
MTAATDTRMKPERLLQVPLLTNIKFGDCCLFFRRYGDELGDIFDSALAQRQLLWA